MYITLTDIILYQRLHTVLHTIGMGFWASISTYGVSNPIDPYHVKKRGQPGQLESAGLSFMIYLILPDHYWLVVTGT